MAEIEITIQDWLPPTDVGQGKIVAVATAASAANWDWVTALGADAPKTHCIVRVEARAQDAYIRFKPTATAAATTNNNGTLIKADAATGARYFRVDPTVHDFIDVIAAGVGSLKLQVCAIGHGRVSQ